VKGTSGSESCIRCRIKGKTLAEWTHFYSGNTGIPVRSFGGGKKDSNTTYFATIEFFPERKREDMDKYKSHVTHCTPCNLDTERNYVRFVFILVMYTSIVILVLH
jgi:hypothetical protein